ncbi:uncharacterized protein LOC144908692 isoform X1 [Branchiostoma floridae x Branchiostoma belcheri]
MARTSMAQFLFLLVPFAMMYAGALAQFTCPADHDPPYPPFCPQPGDSPNATACCYDSTRNPPTFCCDPGDILAGLAGWIIAVIVVAFVLFFGGIVLCICCCCSCCLLAQRRQQSQYIVITP